MLDHNRYALKEWAIHQQVLADGRQILLVKKGGIHEKRGGFTVEHREFFLFPTRIHQAKEDLIPLFHRDLESIQAAPHDEKSLTLEYYATVEDVRRVADLALVHALAGHHILSASAVDERFHYRNNPGVHVMALRIHRLPAPRTVAVRESYGGCVSWVDLEEEVPTAGATPVLSDAAFSERIGAVRALLAPVPVL